MVLASPPPSIRRCEVFRNALILAVTEGQSPSRTCDLAVETRLAIEAIADRHPEASPHLIVEAYDAFDRARSGGEWRISTTPPNC